MHVKITQKITITFSPHLIKAENLRQVDELRENGFIDGFTWSLCGKFAELTLTKEINNGETESDSRDSSI